ncbi:MAG: cupin domain-containing protein, partial [Burkholderiaceae bacterium]
MRDYWQRRPILLSAALPRFETPISREQLFAWAADEDVDSRLVTNVAGRWNVQHGPLARLPALARPGWTLLVQGVDLLDDAARALLSRFRFLPDARLDDLMVSYASDGGGVGPHVDSYDVFLLQAHGRRRWRISRQTDLQLRPGLPLRVLANFRPEQEWVLEAGDMLY